MFQVVHKQYHDKSKSIKKTADLLECQNFVPSVCVAFFSTLLKFGLSTNGYQIRLSVKHRVQT